MNVLLFAVKNHDRAPAHNVWVVKIFFGVVANVAESACVLKSVLEQTEWHGAVFVAACFFRDYDAVCEVVKFQSVYFPSLSYGETVCNYGNSKAFVFQTCKCFSGTFGVCEGDVSGAINIFHYFRISSRNGSGKKFKRFVRFSERVKFVFCIFRHNITIVSSYFSICRNDVVTFFVECVVQVECYYGAIFQRPRLCR